MFKAHGVRIDIHDGKLSITPSLILRCLGATDHTVALSSITDVAVDKAPTSLTESRVTIKTTTEDDGGNGGHDIVVRLSPGHADDAASLATAVRDAAAGKQVVVTATPIEGLTYEAVWVDCEPGRWDDIRAISVATVTDGLIDDSKRYSMTGDPRVDAATLKAACHALSGDNNGNKDRPTIVGINGYKTVASLCAAAHRLGLSPRSTALDFAYVCATTMALAALDDTDTSDPSLDGLRAAVGAPEMPETKGIDPHLKKLAELISGLYLKAGASGGIAGLAHSLGLVPGHITAAAHTPMDTLARSKALTGNDSASASNRRRSRQPAWKRAASPSTIPPANDKADPENPLYGHTVVLSGEFSPFDKEDLYHRIADRGATIGSNVTQKTTILVAGPWETKTGKVKRAEKLLSQGHNIRIISAQDLYDMLGITPSGLADDPDEQPPF